MQLDADGCLTQWCGRDGEGWGDVERAAFDAIKVAVGIAKPSYRQELSMYLSITDDGGEKVYLGSRPDLWIPQEPRSGWKGRNGLALGVIREVGGAKWTTTPRNPVSSD